jgi:putative ABC transport system permease protein
MLNHLRFAVRIFLKDKFFSALNILGLALGIAVSIVLLLILQNDLNYDKYHVNHKQIYRLGAHTWAPGVDFRTARAARELNSILPEEMADVQAVVRANSWDRTMVKYKPAAGDEKSWYEENIVRLDSNYFTVFTHQFVAGDPATALDHVNTVVLSESTARKYFGDEPALDKMIVIDTELFKVTGVIEDVPANTHLKFDLALSQFGNRDWAMKDGAYVSEAFWNPDVYLYILFPENYDPKRFEEQFKHIYDKYYKSFGDQVSGHYEPILERLDKIHFNSTLDGDEPRGNKAYLYAFTGIGVFIILLACINYMNLSTAKSVNRAGEIAMKKTLGSGKVRLVASVLTESILLSLFAYVIAIGLVFLIVNGTAFNNLIEKELTINFLSNPTLMWGSLTLALAIGIVSGLYPALYLTAIPTLVALKGAYKNKKSSLYLRKVLTTAQFIISIFVVACTMLMNQQIDFVRSKNLGFDKENIVLLSIQDSVIEHSVDAISNELMHIPGVAGTTTSYSAVGVNTMRSQSVMKAEGPEGMKQQTFTQIWVGENYLKTMGMELIEGRDFEPAEYGKNFIVNEAAVKVMGWGEDALGKRLMHFHDTDENKKVIGVVKNFNFNSLHNEIGPLVINYVEGNGGFLHVKVKSSDLPATMEKIREVWTKYETSRPYEYFFLDERFNELYKADEVQYKLVNALSWVCVFISLLGLLGLSAFAAVQRTKEIGVRKVHGATIPQIIYLLYKDVMYLVLVASLIVVPLSWYVITQWLSNFAYRAPIDYMVFLIVGALSLLFAFLTVAFHSLKTARTNPVESLRYE